jgi:hypothetical protein
MVHLVRNGLLLITVDNLPDLERVLLPALLAGQIITKPLSQLPFTAAATDKFLNGNGNAQKRFFEFPHGLAQVVLQDGFGMMQGQNLKVLFSNSFEHLRRSPTEMDSEFS